MYVYIYIFVYFMGGISHSLLGGHLRGVLFFVSMQLVSHSVLGFRICWSFHVLLVISLLVDFLKIQYHLQLEISRDPVVDMAVSI